ncbi:MAG: peptidylprolyl isomerase [Chthonomonas sp.]|nr:peptidylprolyl isomerase [Chthonomonas sp.]
MTLSATAAPGATAPAAGDTIAIVETNHGRIVLKFFPEVAPGHVANFTSLAAEGYYDGVRFHRVIPGFMIQGGDPNSRDMPRGMHGTGGPEKKLNAEFNHIPHTPGILSMARTSDPNSAGSQFFIMHNRHVDSLDGQYTVFGQVIEGMDVVDAIANLPRDGRDNPNEDNPAIMESVTVGTWE